MFHRLHVLRGHGLRNSATNYDTGLQLGRYLECDLIDQFCASLTDELEQDRVRYVMDSRSRGQQHPVLEPTDLILEFHMCERSNIVGPESAIMDEVARQMLWSTKVAKATHWLVSPFLLKNPCDLELTLSRSDRDARKLARILSRFVAQSRAWHYADKPTGAVQ